MKIIYIYITKINDNEDKLENNLRRNLYEKSLNVRFHLVVNYVVSGQFIIINFS